MSDTRQPPGTWADEMNGAAAFPALSGGPAHQGGVGKGGGHHSSWAQMLGSTLPTRLNKNVLEIVLEKDERGAFNVSDEDCCKVMKKIGLETIPGVQVETVQIRPNGRGVILSTLKDGFPLDAYCRYDVLEVTASGIRAVNVKPAGKREVIVTIKGLHPNTRDEAVIDYLNKFGRVVTTKVVHSTFGDGPLKGIKNGDRMFKIELKPSSNIGSYHILDGQKVTARYPGQHQTCARCHETSFNCPGGGMARRCEAAGGIKVELCDHIMQLWQKIGYSPGELEVAAVYDDHGQEVEEPAVASPHTGGKFTPVKVHSEPHKFTGVSVKQFPKTTDAGEIMEFLVRSGLPETAKDSVLIKANGHVTVKNLENDVCMTLIENIHNKKNFNRKLFCNGIIPLTPEKPLPSSVPTPQVSATTTATTTPTAPATVACSLAHGPPAHDPPASDTVVTKETSAPAVTPTMTSPASSVEVSPTQFSAGSLTHIIGDQSFLPTENDEAFLRRHSLSLRTPPHGSLAKDILYSAPSFLKTRNILSEIKQMSEHLSDFGSCVSSTSASEEENDVGWKSKKKKKRKSSRSPPDKSFFLKKINSENQSQVSPTHSRQ